MRTPSAARLPSAIGLDRSFRIIAFDWDGTAVENRSEDATEVRGIIERLLRCAVRVVVVSGTSLRNIDGQLSRAIRGPHKRRLYLATNRGSEVFGFDERGDPSLLFRRTATADEERLLTEVADAVRDEVTSRTGLEVRVVYNRLNRRKIDLIPLPGWEDPPKSAIGELLEAVESRLRGAGLAGGIEEVFRFAERVCRERGLSGAKVTSDVKHIEVGLTDKSDSIDWVLRELAGPARIRAADLLIGGDELGPIAGFLGSDAKMIVPKALGATFVSVGPEPNGVPEGVLHLAGGPPRFRALLASQASRHPVRLPASPTRDSRWLLAEDSFLMVREHEIESLFAIGNGRVGTRASLAEGSPLSSPATFVSGLFHAPGGGSGLPELAPIPDWTHLAASIDGHPVRLDTGVPELHRRMLDLRQGILWREWRQHGPDGRVTTVRALRLISQADRHLLVQSITLTPENYSGRLTLEATVRTSMSARTSRGEEVALTVETFLETPERFGRLERLELDIELGRTYRLDRLVSLATSREGPRPAEIAAAHLEQIVSRQGSERAVDAHRRSWRELWRRADVRVEGDPIAQHALRFAAYHLLSAADPEESRSSIAARALTGHAYKGHVFWDTEIFMLPFFVLTLPAAARSLLMYRYRTLGTARGRAQTAGLRGAWYAWESADTGEDVTPPFAIAPEGELVPILNGLQELHINADIAYAVWNYWQATDDHSFLLEAGAEILIETARFWASRVEPGEDGRLHLRRVIGPDEYHETVDDNAYTNVMAQWNLERAAEVAALLAERWPRAWDRLSRQLSLSADEAGQWLRVASGLYTGFDPTTGLFEQFRGYFALDRVDLAALEPRTAPMDVLLGRARIQRSQIVKQADVVMLIYLLWDRFPEAVREANFRYYEPRTDHGSSLSPPIHAAVAARLGMLPLAERYFRQTAEIDFADNMGNAAGGVHIGALGGLWQATVFGFGGLELNPRPRLNPRLPGSWRRLELTVTWKGKPLRLSASAELPGRSPAEGLGAWP